MYEKKNHFICKYSKNLPHLHNTFYYYLFILLFNLLNFSFRGSTYTILQVFRVNITLLNDAYFHSLLQ